MPPRNELTVLELFCARRANCDAYRVHMQPDFVPRSLVGVLDDNYESKLLELDFEELDRKMSNAKARYTKHATSHGIALRAEGDAVGVLAHWLSTAAESRVAKADE